VGAKRERNRPERNRRLGFESLEGRQMMAHFGNTITHDDVERLLQRAAGISSSNDAIIAIVDRGGNILGVRVEQGVFDQYVALYGLATPQYFEKLAFAIDGAVAKARTAANFASGDSSSAYGSGIGPLTSRTIRSLSQSTILEREVDSDPNFRSPAFPDPFDSPILGPGVVAPIGIGGHFPPDVNYTPPVDLFDIEFQGRDSLLHPGADGYKGSATDLYSNVGSDDIVLPNRFNVPNAYVNAMAPMYAPESWGYVTGIVPNAQARGYGTLPGGIPLYKDDSDLVPGGDTLVGGIGVFFPGPLGYATYEQGFVPASMLPPGQEQTTLQRLNAPRVLEAEAIAFFAAGGSTAAANVYHIAALSTGTAAIDGFDLPLGRIDLVGITLEVYGPNPTQQNPNPGVVTLLNKRRQLGVGNQNSGANVPVSTNHAITAIDGKYQVPGWLVMPHDSPLPGGPTAADVIRIVNQGTTQADLTRAAIRVDPTVPPLGSAGPRTKMVFSVADKAGNVLGIYRMTDATIFSIDVAVAKARNTAYYADPTALQPEDKVDDDLLRPDLLAAVTGLIHNNGLGISDTYADINDTISFDESQGLAFTNRTFRFLAEPRFPAGQDGTVPPVFSVLTDPGSNIGNGDILRPDGVHIVNVPAKAFQSASGFNAFHVGRNFHDPSDIANQNGIVFFPGSTPIYAAGMLIGGFGVSGDGVDQDDVVTSYGQVGFEPPANIRADRVFYRGVRLPFQKFNRNPNG
jgi:uncharacterized protein GlcG (DUF336 family)